MPSERPEPANPVLPIASIEDPRMISILSTEHWSLLSARSLAYNEAFVRAGMFLSFLSMSFVALALLAQAMSFGQGFLGVAAVVLAFDVVVGVTTFMRINGANLDDLHAVHGMARIRHAYTQITPMVTPYFTTPTHDDVEAVTSIYGPISPSLPGQMVYALTTSNGMIGLIVSMVGGVFTAVVALFLGFEEAAAMAIGVAGGLVLMALLFGLTARSIGREQARLESRFPTPAPEPATVGEAQVPTG